MSRGGVIINSKRGKIIIFLILILVVFSVVGYAFSNPKGLSINFKDIDLKEAFRTLAEMTEVNIAVDNNISGKITVYLEDVSLINTLDVLTKTNDLEYIIVNKTFFVTPIGKVRSVFGGKRTKVFKLKNGNPNSIRENIKHLVSDGIVKINDRTNSLIVTTYENDFFEIEKIIANLDSSKRQVALQVRFEEVSHSALRDLGIKWELGEEGAGTIVNKANDSLKIGNLNFGYQVSLKALESSGVANVLANPRITTIEGEEAQINIGDQIPIVKVIKSEGAENKQEVSKEVEYKDIGIDLKITPKITEDKKVFIELSPEITTFIDWIDVDGTKYPEISVKKVVTQVEVESGQTIAIGGLIKEQEHDRVSKVPFLGSIPVLGKLFQNKEIEIEKRELIIFITPQILGEEG